MDCKEQILDVAKRRFDRFGFRKTTVDEISRDAGISKKTLYENFKNKEDIFVSLFIREALTARKTTLDRLKNITEPHEKISKFMVFASDYFREHPFMVKVLQDVDGLYAPFLSSKYRVFVEGGILNIFESMLEEGIKKGAFCPLDIKITSYIIFKLFQAFTYADTMSPQKRQISKDARLKELNNFITRALNVTQT